MLARVLVGLVTDLLLCGGDAQGLFDGCFELFVQLVDQAEQAAFDEFDEFDQLFVLLRLAGEVAIMRASGHFR